MELINIGIIQKPFGIRGEVKIMPKTDFVKERFAKGNHIMMELNGKSYPFVIESMRNHKGSVLVKFEGLDTLNDVEHFHQGELFISKEMMHELPEDEYYFSDLEDCHVFSNNIELGIVSEVMDTPAHPILRVKAEDRDILIPFVEKFIAGVDIDEKRIDVDWMEGL
ncbi:16S rRNA processing protein RimM [Erysipelothrix inopinata]|uniref:Ribosome maturation factor RimM n=1 Tax=Erysipelothrix inopinata TaxID=225084 RepID=A0A7G9RYR8_9FIRM|nr:ribosome maturation factor RimM [Erysipelothrix inopinata]QNN60743.1 16S rRNA processing protein RimM [Erysipelothrix inopinata]